MNTHPDKPSIFSSTEAAASDHHVALYGLLCHLDRRGRLHLGRDPLDNVSNVPLRSNGECQDLSTCLDQRPASFLAKRKNQSIVMGSTQTVLPGTMKPVQQLPVGAHRGYGANIVNVSNLDRSQ